MNDTLTFMAWLQRHHATRQNRSKYPLLKREVITEILRREDVRSGSEKRG